MSVFHHESLKALRAEQDKIQRRISQVYDDKLDGIVDEKMYLEKVREYKIRQAEILDEMMRHEVADQNFYITANMVLKLAAKARELFESSEVEEKRQLLNFVFQNLRLDKKTLLVDTHEPFSTIMGYKQCPREWGNLDLNQGPTGYEGGGPPYNPIPSNRYEYDSKGFLVKKLLAFIGF